MYELERVRSNHKETILRFEKENRAYFAKSINDRGDDYFEKFDLHHRELLAEQEAGTCAFYVLVEDATSLVGRFNLYEIHDGSANLGYRVGEGAANRGVATAGVHELCLIAREQYALQTLKATTSDVNVASQRVLTKAGFEVVEATTVAGMPGLLYELNLEGLET
jgi:[ribosomal protein S5]-alanine N-acetyltransferase